MKSSSTAALQVTQRIFALEGEARINLLRVLAVALFFVLHLVNRGFVGMGPGQMLDLGDGTEISIFDTAATALTIAWGSMAGCILVVLRTNRLRKAVGFASTIADASLLSVLLFLGNGPTSPLVFVFFLLIGASALRGQRVYVWLSTLLALGTYGATIGYATYRPHLMPPPYHILMVTASLAIMGVVMDLLIGTFWNAVDGHGETHARIQQLDPTTLRPPTRREPCPWCGVAVGAGMLDCARCQQPLVAGQAFTHDVVTTRSGSVYVAWAVSVFGLVVMSVAVGIALAIEWPALLVPYAGATAILLLGLGRIIQLDLRADQDDALLGQAATAMGTAAATLALGATAVTLLIIMGIMVAVFAMVVAMALCFAVIAGAGSM